MSKPASKGLLDLLGSVSPSAKEKPSFLYSPLWIVLWGILTFAAFVLEKELLFYGFVLTCGLCVIAFAADLAPIMPMFLLCYVTPSRSNNPGQSEEGLFYGASGRIVLCLGIIAFIALLLRITLDQRVGWKRFFTMKRGLAGGILALGAAYLLSGIGSSHYVEDAPRNIAFALIQFAGVFLLYFLFSATVRWEKFRVDYLAWSGLVAGLVVLAELIWCYCTQNVWLDGAIDRERLVTGWGIYNNMGAIIATAIPFAFYLAQKKKHNSVYLILAVILLLGVVFSCSRSSVVFALPISLLCYVYTFVKTENKKEYGITSAVLVAAIGIAGAVLWQQARHIFEKVPAILDVIDGSVVFDDSGRLEIYRAGWESFLQNPVFGQGFFPRGYDFPDFSVVDRFSGFFPPRLHNTVIQILATCGAVGMLAYLYHRAQTVRLFAKKWSVEKAYIAFYVLLLLLMSLLDCHFFNVGPTLFYSIALAVAEFAEDPKQKDKKKTLWFKR